MNATDRASRRPRVLLELSPKQVGDVVRAAQGARALPLALLGDVGQALAAAAASLQDPGLSRSLIHGFLVLACFSQDDGDLGNSEIAGMLDMSRSTCHRYLLTLVAPGAARTRPRHAPLQAPC